ncbi:phosphatidylserine/phosphatidylglycerophosphate/cardiolipin synthase family protein [Arthrobacter sp. 24S4-2]|nr:phosphatidylserine/phosphatidylglycerophosphate/cardiolipin synthase family protein [Arthrobacter sp. 24S4-2]
MRRSRTIRTRSRSGITMTQVLSTVLVSELVRPSKELWLVSAWVSDVPVIRNDMGAFDDIIADSGGGALTLSHVLGRLSLLGAQINVAVRDDQHNEQFLDILRRRCVPTRLRIQKSPDLHEKILVGDDWLLKGSMNFTWNGLNVNEESMEFVADAAEAAKHRLELSVRWGEKSA